MWWFTSNTGIYSPYNVNFSMYLDSDANNQSATKGALELLQRGAFLTAALPRDRLSWLLSRNHGVKIGKKSFRNRRRSQRNFVKERRSFKKPNVEQTTFHYKCSEGNTSSLLHHRNQKPCHGMPGTHEIKICFDIIKW